MERVIGRYLRQNFSESHRRLILPASQYLVQLAGLSLLENELQNLIEDSDGVGKRLYFFVLKVIVHYRQQIEHLFELFVAEERDQVVLIIWLQEDFI